MTITLFGTSFRRFILTSFGGHSPMKVTLLYFDQPTIPRVHTYFEGVPNRQTWSYYSLTDRPQVYGEDKDDPQPTLSMIKRWVFSNKMSPFGTSGAKSLQSRSNALNEASPWGILWDLNSYRLSPASWTQPSFSGLDLSLLLPRLLSVFLNLISCLSCPYY